MHHPGQTLSKVLFITPSFPKQREITYSRQAVFFSETYPPSRRGNGGGNYVQFWIFFRDFLRFSNSPISLSLFLLIRWRVFTSLNIDGSHFASLNFNNLYHYFLFFCCSFFLFLSFHVSLFSLLGQINALHDCWYKAEITGAAEETFLGAGPPWYSLWKH